MEAFLLSAGLGTRLKPITNNIPKALVCVNGKTLLEHNITALKNAGFTTIVINVHHFASQITSFLANNNYFDTNIIVSDETNQLLDTGGGLKKASRWFKTGNPVLVQNVDILTSINYKQLFTNHYQNKSIATLAVRQRQSGRYLLFDKNNLLVGWQNSKTNQFKWVNLPCTNFTQFAFSGIHVVSPELFSFLANNKSFSIIDTYLEISRQKKITAYNHTSDYWFDIGSIDKMLLAEQFFCTKK